MNALAGIAIRATQRGIARTAIAAAGLACFALPAGGASAPEAEAAARFSSARYQPPAEYPAPRRVGGSARGGTPALPAIAVLAPDHLGLTRSEQPRLYWFISEPTRARVEFTLVQPGLEAPVVETTLEAPVAGIHALDLARMGARLEAGVEYEWSVALVADAAQRSRDVVAGGAIMRIPASGPAPADAAEYARQGLWYDALMALDRSPHEPQGPPAARERRAALLEQAGLHEIARFERR